MPVLFYTWTTVQFLLHEMVEKTVTLMRGQVQEI